MNGTYRFLILGFSVLCFASAFAADPSAATVAVVDFTVPAEVSNTWAWARGGIADLLQIELDQRGLVTLDRSFIQAVLSERRMAVGGLTRTDCKSIATLIGAKYLVTGNVKPLEDGKCRIEASAFSVETFETVSVGMGEGKLPKDLPLILQKVADAVAGVLLKESATRIVAPGDKNKRPDPEALIAYYRGLDAYSAGYPAIAAGWFIYSQGLDKNFLPPRLWEVKAYRAAGREDHARISEQASGGLLDQLVLVSGSTNRLSESGAKIVALIRPSVIPLADNAPRVAASALEVSLKSAILESHGIRLFDPRNMKTALAEQDRTLNVLFSSREAIRYGLWTVADAVLFSRIDEQPGDTVVLTLSLRNMSDPKPIVERSEAMPLSDLSRRSQDLAARMLKEWLKGSRSTRESANSTTGSVIRVSGQIQESRAISPEIASRLLNDLPSPYHVFVSALMASPPALRRVQEKEGLEMRIQQMRRNWDLMKWSPAEFAPVEVDVREQWAMGDFELMTLSDALRRIRRYDHMAPEIACRIDAADWGSEWAACDLWECACYCGTSLDAWFFRERRARPLDLLLTRFPDSICSAERRQVMAIACWEAKDWSGARSNALESRRVLRKIIDSIPAQKLERADIDKVVKDLRKVIVTSFYIQADAAASLGNTNEAVNLFTETESYIQQNAVDTNGMPYRLNGFTFDSAVSVLAGGRGSAGAFSYVDSLSSCEQHGRYARLLLNWDRWGGASKRICEGVGGVQSGTPAGEGDDVSVAESLVHEYEIDKDTPDADVKLLGEAENILAHYTNHFREDKHCLPNVRRLIERMFLARLVRNGVPSLAQAGSLPPERLKEVALHTLDLYERCGLADEWGALLGPLLDAPYSTDVGVALLLKGPMSAGDFGARLERLVQRLQAKGQDTPYTLWIKCADSFASADRFLEAFPYYQAAFQKGAPRKMSSDLLVSITAVALQKQASRVDEGIKRRCAEFGVPPAYPVPSAWFNLGRCEEKAGRFSSAAICYRHVGSLLDHPDSQSNCAWEVFYGDLAEAYKHLHSNPGMYMQQPSSLKWRYFLARCLVKTGAGDEAAPILRDLVREYGDMEARVDFRCGDYDNRWEDARMKIGVEAQKMLEKLHAQVNP